MIRTLAELALRNPGADKDSLRAFAEIVEESGRTSRLLEEMLLLARADDGTAHLSFEPVDMAEIVRVVGAKARLLAEAKGHTLNISLPAAETRLVRGDYSTLHRLLWILVDNAVKYTKPPGTIHIALKESCRGPDDRGSGHGNRYFSRPTCLTSSSAFIAANDRGVKSKVPA